MHRFRIAAFSFSLLICLGCSSAWADGTSGSKFLRSHCMGWAFAPAVASGQVLGFMGWEEDNTAVLGNLKVMWFERGNGGRWNSWAWQGNDLGAAVASVRTLLNDQSLFATDPLLSEAAANFVGQGLVFPQAVVKGMLADDMLASTVENSSHPDELVDMLASVGWPVGPTLSAELAKASKECGGELVTPLDADMDHLANHAESILFGSAVTADHCAEVAPCVCDQTVTYTPTPATAPWTNTGSTVHAGTRTCRWTRPATCVTTYSGQAFVSCATCTTPPTPPTACVEVTFTDVLATEACTANTP